MKGIFPLRSLLYLALFFFLPTITQAQEIATAIRVNADELHQFLEGLPELFNRSPGIIKTFEEFTAIDLVEASTTGTGVAKLTVFLKPSKTFLDFVAAVKAGNVE